MQRSVALLHSTHTGKKWHYCTIKIYYFSLTIYYFLLWMMSSWRNTLVECYFNDIYFNCRSQKTCRLQKDSGVYTGLSGLSLSGMASGPVLGFSTHLRTVQKEKSNMSSKHQQLTANQIKWSDRVLKWWHHKNDFAGIMGFFQYCSEQRISSHTKHSLVSALSSSDMGVWSSHFSTLNSLI